MNAKRRALGSMRDPDGNWKMDGKSSTRDADGDSGKGSGEGATKKLGDVKGKGALHRSSMRDADCKTTSSSKAATETVRVKPPDALAAKAQALLAAPSHDVGWKQRLPPSTGAAVTTANTAKTTATLETTATKYATTTIIKSSSTAPSTGVVSAPLRPFGTAKRIVQREGPLALYKGLTAGE